MNHKHSKSIFIFRRDLRLKDNTGLITALALSEKVVPCFIFDPKQLERNPYRSNNALQFMLDCLEELDAELRKLGSRLHCFYGKPEEVVGKLIKREKIDAVFVNHGYTPFSRKRDKQLQQTVELKGAHFESCFDLLLTEVGSVLTGKGTPYTIFTPFFKKASKLSVVTPKRSTPKNFYKGRIASANQFEREAILPAAQSNSQIIAAGGRKAALRILKKIGTFEDYERLRNLPAESATTRLSAHNKFGTVSIREVYHRVRTVLGESHPLIRQLYWRDFFSHIAFNFPHVFGHAFHRKYDRIEWSKNHRGFKAWCEGRTGFPIVDAGMRQLNTTGFMHNRVRMITASFLVKDLHIDWRWGEKYFAQNLIDYDPAVNNGNWQWAASTGCDAQPYFRIFNPWIQGRKFDPDCEYIKRWIPELCSYSARDILRLEKGGALPGYPPAIVDHAEAKEIAEELYTSVVN